MKTAIPKTRTFTHEELEQYNRYRSYEDYWKKKKDLYFDTLLITKRADQLAKADRRVGGPALNMEGATCQVCGGPIEPGEECGWLDDLKVCGGCFERAVQR